MAFGQTREVNGISENILDKLIIEICDRADNIKAILNSIDDEIYKCLSNVESSATTQFKYAYEEMKKNYKCVNKNILSYSTDYVKVKNAYIERTSTITEQVGKFAENVHQMNNYEEGR